MEKGWELRTRIQKEDPHYFAVARSGGSTQPLLANLETASTCHTECRITKRKERK